MTMNSSSLPNPQLEEASPAPAFNPKTRRMIKILQVLTLFVILVGVILLVKSEAFSFIVGEGSVRGFVVDQNGTPVAGKVYIESTLQEADIANNGYFEIRGIPLGHQTLLLTWMYAGFKAPVEIHRGGITDLGTITVPTKPRADHNIPRLEWR